jgi:hypothetical protein
MLTHQNNLTLYHASFAVIEAANLSLCRKRNDFGQGFYLTTSKTQAERFVKTAVLKNGTEQKTGYVNEYLFESFDGLRCHEFATADRDWLRCVCANRRFDLTNDQQFLWDEFEVLIGKIANDDTMTTINIYLSEGYGPIDSEESIETAIRVLKPERLQDQICLKSQRALESLQFKTAYEVLFK